MVLVSEMEELGDYLLLLRSGLWGCWKKTCLWFGEGAFTEL